MKLLREVIISAVLLGAQSTHAQIAMSGSMKAMQACPAYQSIAKQANPGSVMLEVGRAYQVVGKNKSDASYYQIVVDGAAPARRWVAVGCGEIAANDAGASGATATKSGAPATYVLALGWEPAFCVEHSNKTECANESASSFDSTHLSLHGLWPQPRGKAYCNVDSSVVAADKSHDWGNIPEPQMTAETRQRLAAAMPGFESGLERHEWTVHGTCSGVSPDVYFNRAAELTEQINATTVRELFTNNVGRPLSSDAIRAAFDQAFGAGAGTRVAVNCQGHGANRAISQIVISLGGDVTGSTSIGSLISASASVPEGCPSGMITTPMH